MTQRWWMSAWMLGCLQAVAMAGAPADGLVQFNRDIRPILSDNCFHCHGPDPASRKENLRFDREEGFFGQRDNGVMVIPGKPLESPLYQRLITTDRTELMPPPKSHKTLTDAQKELVRKWIEQGAKWQPHWSFIKPEKPALPEVKDAAWVRNPIDRFVLAKLEAAGLKPAPEADRATLARRVALDITGLPPEPAVVEAFLRDKAPDAYEKLVDKLLASPRYGEHRARYWLDAARYADTHGLHFDNFRDIWPYRDWVVNAYNRNLPFDQFTIEQLAGDLLPNPTKDQIVATGFQRCAITTNEGGTIAEENIANLARDRVETTSWVWLGLTANCSTCHDHKFDPITMRDFYSMSAYFRNTTQGATDGNVRNSPPVMILAMGDDAMRLEAIAGESAAVKKNIASRKTELTKDFDQWIAKAKPEDADKLGTAAGLIVHAPLDEGKGEQIACVIGEQHKTVQATGTLTWRNDGKQGAAPVLANGAQVDLGDVANFEHDSQYTVAAWVFVPKGSQGGAVVAKMGPGPGYQGWDIWVQGDRFASHLVSKWGEQAIKVASKSPTVKFDQWQHVAVVRGIDPKDRKKQKLLLSLYVDGKLQETTYEANTLKTASTKTTVPVRIGQREQGQGFGGGVQDLRIYDRGLSAAEVAGLTRGTMLRSYLAQEPTKRDAKQRAALLESYIAGDEQLSEQQEKLSALEREDKAVRDRSPVAFIMEEKKNSQPMAAILFRGAYDQPREKVGPAVIEALHRPKADAPQNRLGLAQWIMSPENPLTPRVIVNRHWQELFGVGIVRTSEDFGIMGDEPSHPQLLDYLASDFRDTGWDVKKLIRTMVTSSTYRQSAAATPEKLERDPKNRLLSRGPRFRMDAEMIRDYALAASGLMVEKIGGPSVKPYQPAGVWEAVAMPESNTRFYKQDSGEALYRRSMYTFWKRAAPPASLEILNAPSREVSCIRRERTNTPMQALVTLNDPQFVEAARALAQAAMLEPSSGAGEHASAVLEAMARRALLRSLTEAEQRVLLESQRDLYAYYASNPADAKALITVGESRPDASLDAARLASWTLVANQLFNLDEVLCK